MICDGRHWKTGAQCYTPTWPLGSLSSSLPQTVNGDLYVGRKQWFVSCLQALKLESLRGKPMMGDSWSTYPFPHIQVLPAYLVIVSLFITLFYRKNRFTYGLGILWPINCQAFMGMSQGVGACHTTLLASWSCRLASLFSLQALPGPTMDSKSYWGPSPTPIP